MPCIEPNHKPFRYRYVSKKIGGDEVVTDEELCFAISNGDQAAFEAFVHRYHGPLLGYLERLLNDQKRAEDFVQEVFIKLLDQLKDRTVPTHCRSWLYKVATNLCRDYWRSARFKNEQPLYASIPEQPDDKATVYDIYERQESRMEMIRILNTLPEHQREIIILRFYQDLKLKEISDILDCPIGTIKSRLFHGLRYLKGQLQKRKEEKGHDQQIR